MTTTTPGRTSPRIGEPFVATNAVIKARLYDFRTGSATLQPEHKAWLNNMVATAKRGRYFMDVIGYASKTGSASLNQKLSEDRVNSVLSYLQGKSFNPPTRHLEFLGEGAYQAPESDNSADWRAVELHYYKAPPKPPKKTKPKPPLPGTKKFTNWEVGAVFGVSGGLGLTGAADLLLFRKTDPPVQEHWYLALEIGAGASWGPKLKALKPLIQKILTNSTFAGLQTTAFTAATPFNFADLHTAKCNLKAIGAGVGVGYQKALLSVKGPLWMYDNQGRPTWRPSQEFFSNVNVGGKLLMLGGGGMAVGGFLYKVW